MRRGARVVVVEDDAPIRSAIGLALKQEGYEVRAEPDGSAIDSVVSEFRPDLAILDIRFPTGPDGYAVATQLRETTEVPLLFLSAADGVDDRLAAFDVGADDYIVKPFSVPELMARVKAVLRRCRPLSSSVYEIDDLVVDDDSRTAVRAGMVLNLTRIEHDLLSVLVRNPGRVLSKAQLLNHVWGFDGCGTNVVEVHLSALRRKVDAKGPRLVHTVHGVGYVARPS